MGSGKVIYADDLKAELRDDLTIRGAAFAAVMRHIDKAATAEVAPVVHGRWAIINEDCCVCSACHNASIQTYYFCPECGAIMDLPHITEETAAAIEKMGRKAHGEAVTDGRQ